MANKDIQKIEEKLRKRGDKKLTKDINSIYNQIKKYISDDPDGGLTNTYVVRYFEDILEDAKTTIYNKLFKNYEQREIDTFLETVDEDDIEE